MLSNTQQTLINNILYTGSRLVLLQTLKAGYLTEQGMETTQEIKNFRTGVLIDEIRGILESLKPMAEYFALIDEGKIIVNPKDLPSVRKLIRDLYSLYEWCTEEVKLKTARANLLDMEMKWGGIPTDN